MSARVEQAIQAIEAILSDSPDAVELRDLCRSLHGCAIEAQALFLSAVQTRRQEIQTRLLNAEQVAEVLGMPVRSVYRNAWRWPFTRREGRLLRFDEEGALRYIRGRKA